MGHTGRAKLEESGNTAEASVILALTTEMLLKRLLKNGLDSRELPRDSNSGAARDTEERKASCRLAEQLRIPSPE
jgi:hypothetical protein